jgi:putative membrane protein
MFGAFIVSTVFLVAYVANHVLHGDMLFPRAYPTARFFYLWILLTPHILLATICLPMILITFFLSLTGRFPAHKKLARWTYPIWLYVSVSGVIVYAMLAAYR